MRRFILFPGLERKTAAAAALHHTATRFACKAAEKRQFSGLASTWDLDQGGDKIVQGAYTRTLSEWKSSGRTIPLINQHQYWDAKNAIGKMIAAEETDVGLETTFQVVGSAEGEEFMARIRDGILDGLSIGYEVRGWRPPSEEERARGIQRVLTDIELMEVSLVIWGMNQNALIDGSSVKSIATALSRLTRETLTDDDRKTVRQIAALSGALLRPKSDQPPASGEPAAADAASDDEKEEKPPTPAAPPESSADAPKAYPNTEALQQRLLSLRIGKTLTTTRGLRS